MDQPQAATATLIVRMGDAEPREFPLDPAGRVIGRTEGCDIRLEDAYISRRHARIYRDPFGRWIIEDLGSHNGIIVNRQCVRAATLLPGDEVVIGPFYLSLALPSARPTAARAGIDTRTTTVVTEDETAEGILRQSQRPSEVLSRARLKELNALMDRLARLTRIPDVHAEACRQLAGTPGTMAAVLRLPTGSTPLPDSPDLLAYHLGDWPDGRTHGGLGRLPLSRRVLQAVRTSGESVSANSVAAAGTDLGLTVVDARAPRAVFCAPVAEDGPTMDVLYLDMPAGRSGGEMADFFTAVARQVGFAGKSLLLVEATARRRVLDHQLEMAQRIQQRLTPGLPEPVAGVDIAVCYLPALWVGGDYCDLWRLKDGKLALALGDVSGKGLPAAMVMANLQGMLRTAMAYCTSPAEALNHINRHLGLLTPDDCFVTFFFGLLDPASGEMEYANAGHLLPLVLTAAGEPAELGQPQCLPLGVMEGPITTCRAVVAPGTGLMIFTDGVTEAAAPDGRLFGVEGIKSHLATRAGQSAQSLNQSLVQAVTDHRRNVAQQDDLTIMTLLRPA